MKWCVTHTHPPIYWKIYSYICWLCGVYHLISKTKNLVSTFQLSSKLCCENFCIMKKVPEFWEIGHVLTSNSDLAYILSLFEYWEPKPNLRLVMVLLVETKRLLLVQLYTQLFLYHHMMDDFTFHVAPRTFSTL